MHNFLTLFHGSRFEVPVPEFGVGNPHNDYGLGFYCTESRELACEWACPTESDGYVNEYELKCDDLAFVDLDGDEYSILNWLAVLIENRSFTSTSALMSEAKAFLTDSYLIDLSDADVVCGYRADDSYFTFAKAFLENRISLTQLERSMRLGGLGRQVAIKSERAFGALSAVGAEPVDGMLWHARRAARDIRARDRYREISGERYSSDDVFIIDLIRGAR